MLTRRSLLGNTLKISAGLALVPHIKLAAQPHPALTISLRNSAPVVVPANFIGLGYEMSSVATPGLLSAANHRYVELVKGLGPQGVIRVGGIVSDYTRYEPNGTSRNDRQNTVITRASLEQFAAFLEAIGWSAIWSVNFAQGSIEEAVTEARAVASVLGPRLLALEVGNEAENYDHGRKPFRKSPYDYAMYRREYEQWRAAILNTVPNLRFAAPDTASSIEWVERMAADAKGEVQLLTTHYYRNNQAHGSADQLLHPDPRLKDALIRLRIASLHSGIPWRMCETNSFSGGGRPGVSDTFTGALWTLDFMLLLAQYGCSGVNIETGVNQLGFVSSYSPIQDDGKGVNSAGVPYYGMLAFAAAMAGCHQLLPVDFKGQGINITAYVLGSGGKPRSAVIINKDQQDTNLSLANLAMENVSALRMAAPSPGSRTGVTFGASAVNSERRWQAKTHERIRNGIVTIPKMSAVVLRSD